MSIVIIIGSSGLVGSEASLYFGKLGFDVDSVDLISAFHEFFQAPRKGEVYNIGGGRVSNCSMLEAIECCEAMTGRTLNWTYSHQNRIGDHIWWIGDNGNFKQRYPNWRLTYDIPKILKSIREGNVERWLREE